MPYIVRNLPNLTPSSSASAFSNQLGELDDAASLSLFFTSYANANTYAATIQVSQFDPGDAGEAGSTSWYSLSTALATITSSGAQVAINTVAFRGLRLSITTSTAGEIIAFAAKQITV